MFPSRFIYVGRNGSRRDRIPLLCHLGDDRCLFRPSSVALGVPLRTPQKDFRTNITPYVAILFAYIAPVTRRWYRFGVPIAQRDFY